MKFIKTMLTKKPGKINSNLSAPAIDYGSHYKPRRTMMALEPRIMFDGAAAATTADAVVDTKPSVQDTAAIDAAKLAQAAADVVPPAVQVDPVPQRTEIVFIENNVADYQTLVNDAKPGEEVHVLDSSQDGLAQIAQILNGRSGIDAIHIVTHGSEGALLLGSLTLTSQNLQDHAAELTTIGNALTQNADVLLYGCDVGQGSDGAAFVSALAQASQADVAASNDTTGAAALGGNWQLETVSGSIETGIYLSDAGIAAYDYTLASFDFETAAGNGTGTVTQTVSGVTMTVTMAAGGGEQWYAGAGGGIGGTSGNVLVDMVSHTSETFSFSSAVDLTSFRLADQNAHNALVFTPTGGSNSVVNATTVTLGATVLLNWTGVTSFTVTLNGGGVIYDVVYDNFIFTQAGPTITSAAYDASTNSLVVTGTGMTATGGAANDIDVSKLTLTGQGGAIYALTSSSVEIASATQFTVALNAADQINVEGLLNKDGTSSVGGTTFNIAAAADWNPANTGNADLTGNGITVSSVQTPTITSSTYDANTGSLVVTGTNLVAASGATNDITANKLTFTGEGGATYTLTDTANVEITSATAFTLSLSATDKAAINQMLNKNGTASTSATTYNLAAADDWDTVITNGDISDATGNGITVSNVAVPAITSSTYDASTGALVVTGTGFLKLNGATNDIVANKFTFTGEGGATYTLTDTSNVEITSGTAFTITLSTTDKDAINQIINKNGMASTGATTYNLAAAEDWTAGAAAGITDADLTGNGITVSNVAVPAITSSTYDAATGSLVVTGTGFLKLNGATNDIVANKFTFTGEGGATYTLTDTSNVEITSGTAFTLTLSATDKAAINQIINKNGTASTGATTYNLAAAEDWTAGAAAGITDADLTGNGITASNVAVPAITSSSYDAATGALVVTGTGFLSKSGATNDIVANKFTFTGEGGATYTLTDTSNVEITSGTAFTITLSATDKAAINQMINKNGASSTGATTYNLAAAEDWTAGAAAGVTDADLTGNGITASNVAVPAITSSTYDASTGALVVTGTGFLKLNGATNDIVANKFTFTGEGGSTYTLTDTSNVEISSGTAFTLSLSATDKAAINQIINKNGTSSTGATTYNLAAAEDWTAGAAAGVTDADLTGNGITASNVAVPAITSSTYDASTGSLVVTGTGFLKLNGATNDIVANKFTFTGEGGATYTLTDTSNVEITSGTAFTITLSATDKAAINQIINKNGTASTDVSTYNLAAAEDWTAGAAAGVTDADLTGNGITASNVAVPAITSATYDYNTNILVVTGTGFLSKSGATNDIDLTKLTFTGEGGATYTLTNATGVEITSGTSFSVTLSGADLTNVEALLNKDGTSAVSTATYNLSAAASWDRGDATNGSDTTNAITVSNYAAPTVTSAIYDASTNVLTVTGANLVSKSGATNDVAVSLLTLTGEGGNYTLTSSDVEITNATTFSVTLNAADQIVVRGLMNKNGTSSSGATTYNLAAAEDWMAGTATATVVADLTGNGITVSNVQTPTITSSTYDSDTGVLTVTGTNLFKKVGANNDIDLTKLTFTGQGNASYTLTTATGVEITSATSFTATLTGADKTGVDSLLNQIGTSSVDATVYNLAGADDWLTGADVAANIADLTNAITVSISPKITSATYDAATGSLVVTGTNMQTKAGVLNDITAAKLTFTGEGGTTYTLTDTANVELTSATSFTLTLSATDNAAINQIVNKNGTASTGATTYNLAAADDWNAQVTAGDTSDLTGNGITASNVAVPAITSSTYNASTGSLVVTGTGFLKLSGATNDIVANKFTFTGEGGATYTLTDTSNVEITSGTAFTITLSATDQAAINQMINKNGTASSSGTTYNLAAAEDWTAGAAAGVTDADLTGNGITASNVAVPAITSSTYDAATGALVVTGTGFLKKSGATNDIVANKFTFTGEGGATYTLTDTSNVEITSGTSFTITLSATDQAAINQIINKNGTSSTGATTYNLAAAEDWTAGAAAGVTDVDGTNGITASNVAVPAITSSTYDASTGVLVVTGTGFLKLNGATNDIVANKFTFTGEGGATYTLTDTANVEITSGTAFTLTLSATDQAAINQIINKNGTTSTGATTYNLAAAEDWTAGAAAGITDADLTGNGIAASNVAVPAITSSTYDAATGALVVTGTGFLKLNGATNDIVANKFTFTGEGGATYTLTDTSNVEITSGTAFTLTLSATDKAAINQMINKNGTSSTGATTYNLAAAEDWTAGAAAGVTDADLTGNGITASNVAVPAITSSTYDASTGSLVVTGTGFLKKSGATNDIVANKFTFTGEGGATYTLTDTSNVEITSGTAFTITLSATDKAAINQMINKNGTSSTGATTYNLAAAEDWTAGAAAGVTDVDGTNGITAGNVAVPAITSSTYDAATGALVVTGTGFLKLNGASNDIVANKFTFTGEGGATYTLTDTSNVEITSGTAFTLTLSATDKAAINQMINKNGTASTGATTYNLAAAEDWTAGAAAGVTDADLTGNGITAGNVAVPTITSATYVNNTGVLVVTGANFVKKAGATNDIDASKLTFTGQGGATYTLTGTASVEITSTTEFTLTLTGADKTGVNALFNKTGLNANDNTVYNLAAAEDWAEGADAAVVVADLTNNGITVTVNVPPTSINSAITVNEDTSYTFVAGDFNFSDVDPGNVLTQVQITSLPSTGTLALNGTAVTANQVITKADIDAGKLTIRGATDAFGTANTSFQFKVHDGTEYSSTSYTETVNITAVNDAPSFTKGADQTVNEDAGAQTVNSWATGLSKGPVNEADQTLSFTTTNNNNALFSVQPTIDSNGNLTYTPAANANGTATITVSIKDSGGTANGGVDTSITQTFTITVNPVNDLPTGTVTISGIPSVGITLSAANTLTDADGLGAISYQWQADGINITGATGSSYMLTDAEAGKTITVVARYTDVQGGAESVASVATDQVEALAPINLTQQTGNGDDKPSSDTGTGNNTNTNTNTNTGNNTGTGNNSGIGNSTGADRNNNASDTHGSENSGTNTNSFGDNSSGNNNNSNSGSSPNQTIVMDMKLTVDSHGNGTSGGTINLPSSVFAGLNTSGTITITGTQSSGQSLPSFISVNPSTGAVTVKEGAVVTSPITVKVTIRDSQGKQVVVLVKVQPQKGRAQQQNQGQEGDQQPDNENNQQGAGRNQRSHVQQTDKQLAHAGKPGLTQQLQRVGSKGFELQRQTLLDSLASLVGENKDAA